VTFPFSLEKTVSALAFFARANIRDLNEVEGGEAAVARRKLGRTRRFAWRASRKGPKGRWRSWASPRSSERDGAPRTLAPRAQTGALADGREKRPRLPDVRSQPADLDPADPASHERGLAR
jgi:hypothetical protein